jgi:NSS family neurotransmitter:Na+ symporter
MTFVGHVANDTLLPLGGCMIVIFAAYVWKKENLNAEIAVGYPNRNKFVENYINFAVTYLCPIILACMFILTVLNRFFGINLFA